MPLASGAHLGPYEILGPLGSGGMGEVYRARDPRLGREVAVKILSPQSASDRDLLARFEQEARAVSALNHPNIVTVFEIGRADQAPYIVMELIDGKNLNQLLDDGPLPVRRTLHIAAQVADGLAAAHDKGIVHRDLKPENIIITRDGLAKILDFGLAKLTVPELGRGSGPKPLGGDTTGPGVILGTVGYMSPEQARGEPADFRSDQFALGAIIYEMASGVRAFPVETPVLTLSAILEKDPPALASLNKQIPPLLGWIVQSCMAKDPRERYGSTHDLARDLHKLHAHLTHPETMGEPALAVRRHRRRRRADRHRWRRWLLWASVPLAAVAGTYAGWRRWHHPPARVRQVTFQRGTVRSARFAADGHTLVYSAAWDGGPLQLFLKPENSADALAIGPDGANLEAVSASGEMALTLDCRITHNGVCRGTLARAPLTGGTPRSVSEAVQQADWGPDGESLAAVREARGKATLEFPLGHVRYETTGHLSFPRYSPDGVLVALLDHPLAGDDRGAVVVFNPKGERRVLSAGWESVQGLAWAPSGKEVWFTAGLAGNTRSLYAVSLTGKLRLVSQVPGSLRLQDISRTGAVLLTRDNVRIAIQARPPGAEAERELSGLGYSFADDLSADGKTLLYDEEGEGAGPNYAVCLRATDGSPPQRLGEGNAGALSPDGRWAIAWLPSAEAPVMLLPVGSGTPRALARGAAVRDSRIAWFPDGARVLFAGREPGRGVRLYAQSVAGGAPVPLTPEGIGAGFAISADGGRIAAIGPEGGGLFYSVNPAKGEAAAGHPIPGFSPGEIPLRFSGDGRWLYVRRAGELPARIFRIDTENGERELWRTLMPPDPTGVDRILNVLLTPDGTGFAYSYSRVLSDLYVVEGLE